MIPHVFYLLLSAGFTTVNSEYLLKYSFFRLFHNIIIFSFRLCISVINVKIAIVKIYKKIYIKLTIIYYNDIIYNNEEII